MAAKFDCRESILKMPVELLDEVIQQLDSRDQATTCRVSKLFNSLSSRLLYQTIVLGRQREIIQCCRTLVTNPGLAKLVRKLGIDAEDDHKYLPAFFRRISSAVKCVVNVAMLDLRFGDDWQHFNDLETCTFPKLRAYSGSLSSYNALAAFLGRHLQIVNLCVISHFRIPMNCRPIGPLPQLSRYVGPSRLIPSIIPGSPVTSVSFSSIADIEEEILEFTENFDDIVIALTKSTQPITSIECTKVGWCLQYLRSIATHIPDVKDLQLHNIGHPREQTTDLVNFQGFADILPMFRCLDSFSVSYLCLNPFYAFPEYGDDLDILHSWGKLCPSLSLCTLPAGIEWLRIKGNVWAPSPASCAFVQALDAVLRMSDESDDESEDGRSHSDDGHRDSDGESEEDSQSISDDGGQ